jgi:hypothetical protein
MSAIPPQRLTVTDQIRVTRSKTGILAKDVNDTAKFKAQYLTTPFIFENFLITHQTAKSISRVFHPTMSISRLAVYYAILLT